MKTKLVVPHARQKPKQVLLLLLLNRNVLTKDISALIHHWQIQQYFQNRESFWSVKTGLVVRRKPDEWFTTDGSLIVPALKSCHSGILRNRINADFFLHSAQRMGIEGDADRNPEQGHRKSRFLLPYERSQPRFI